MEDSLFSSYCALFAQKGFSLYLVGGAVRDLLLGRPYDDYDFATDALPEQMKEILPDADFTFARFGAVTLRKEGKELTFTTLREEGEYKDSRHPGKVRFISDPKVDSCRRDFTINALYLNGKGEVLDFHQGIEDLKQKKIRFIGNPRKRIEEDPLRILRAERFAATLGFELEEETAKAIEELRPLLSKLNPEKIKMEERKLAKRVK